jgi:hypothetical protein
VPSYLPFDVWVAGALCAIVLLAAIFDPPAELVGGVLMIGVLTVVIEYFGFRQRKG